MIYLENFCFVSLIKVEARFFALFAEVLIVSKGPELLLLPDLPFQNLSLSN